MTITGQSLTISSQGATKVECPMNHQSVLVPNASSSYTRSVIGYHQYKTLPQTRCITSTGLIESPEAIVDKGDTSICFQSLAPFPIPSIKNERDGMEKKKKGELWARADMSNIRPLDPRSNLSFFKIIGCQLANWALSYLRNMSRTFTFFFCQLQLMSFYGKTKY